MAQFARPDATVSIGTWTDQAGGTTTIENTIDESTASDVDYIRSVQAPSNAPFVCSLTAVTDPGTSAGHIIRGRIGKDVSGGAQVDILIQLREGYTNEGAPGTLIAETDNTDVADGFTDFTYTLSAPEADSITDYSDLFLRIVADQP